MDGAAPNRETPDLGQQFLGIFTEPVALFQRLRESPSFGPALILVTLATLFLTVAWGMKVDADAMLRPILEQAQMPQAQIEQAITLQRRFLLPMSVLGGLLGPTTGALFGALLSFLLGLRFHQGERPSYLQALSLSAVVSLTAVPYLLLTGAICLLKPVGGLVPEKLSPSSLGYYWVVENPKLHMLLCQIDAFLILGFVMVYLGARHLLRLNRTGAILCTVLSVLLSSGMKILFAK